ncbi:PREDICTED: uncharacterized protein LOC106805072 [Priapulus caudatus]|uniref:Uncharacterized protein LOC106805072 n=1 Tax=Priapulus caudatus TaxID=37621 RepID=A0ABM1DQ19_PRICU|nr:PREDICTED: uncharacterized protein LOC106805072 [Priapulus caudatus]
MRSPSTWELVCMCAALLIGLTACNPALSTHDADGDDVDDEEVQVIDLDELSAAELQGLAQFFGDDSHPIAPIRQLQRLLNDLEETFETDLDRHIKLFDEVEKTLERENARLIDTPDDYKTLTRNVEKLGDKTIVTNRTVVKHTLHNGKGLSILEEQEVTLDDNKSKDLLSRLTHRTLYDTNLPKQKAKSTAVTPNANNVSQNVDKSNPSSTELKFDATGKGEETADGENVASTSSQRLPAEKQFTIENVPRSCNNTRH